MTRLAGLLAVLGAAFVLVIANVSTASAQGACPHNMKNRNSAGPGGVLSCFCPGNARGSVWGSGRYTTDSSVCRAARHAGAIGPGGGMVRISMLGGCPSFVGTTRNGVRTGRWGSYPRTYYFRLGGPAPSCYQQASMGQVNPCPRTMSAYRRMAPGQRLRCSCSPGQYRGSIWGSGRYTTDSSTCRAAVHYGAIRGSGGVVTVWTYPGCRRFFGSTRNGIRTGNWGAYNRTFTFSNPGPRCQ